MLPDRVLQTRKVRVGIAFRLAQYCPEHEVPGNLCECTDNTRHAGAVNIPFDLTARAARRHSASVRNMRSPSELPASKASATRYARIAQVLHILRYYYDRDGRILQVSLGYCPEGRFSYSTRMRMQHHG